jgi:hypothetical protein
MVWRLAVAPLERTDGILVAMIVDVEVVGSLEQRVSVIVRGGCFLYLLGFCKRGFIIVENRVGVQQASRSSR